MSEGSTLIRLPLPQCFCPRGRKVSPWSEKNSGQNSDHPRLCVYWGKEKLRPWPESLETENSDHGLSFGCFWGRGRRGGYQGYTPVGNSYLPISYFFSRRGGYQGYTLVGNSYLPISYFSNSFRENLPIPIPIPIRNYFELI